MSLSADLSCGVKTVSLNDKWLIFLLSCRTTPTDHSLTKTGNSTCESASPSSVSECDLLHFSLAATNSKCNADFTST